MGKIIILCATILFLQASNLKDKNSTKSITQYKITEKMKIFEQEKKKKEAEAKKLEEDGFCPCSVQMP
jgi:hypothetical protein